MKRKMIVVFFILLVVSTLLIGWMLPTNSDSNNQADPNNLKAPNNVNNKEPDFEGELTKIEPNGIFTIQLQEHGEVLASINNETEIYQVESGQMHKKSSADLKEGQNLQIWCNSIAESYPPSCSAGKVNFTTEDKLSKTPPILTGQIIKVEGDQLTIGQNEDEVKGHVTIDDKTKISLKDGEKLSQVTVSEVKENMKVQVWCKGPVLMIYPMRLTAEELVLEK